MSETGTPTQPRCFIAMPITTHPHEAERYGGDLEHWDHVLNFLFVPAVKEAGYEPVIPKAKGSILIHDMIVTQLVESDLVLCDLSSHNPNVFFELGVRTSLNLPIALVHDGEARLPFDTSGINTASYRPALTGWEVEEDRSIIAQHLTDAAASCAGQNPLWRQFGLQIQARQPTTGEDPIEAKIDLLLQARSAERAELEYLNKRLHKVSAENASLVRDREQLIDEVRRDEELRRGRIKNIDAATLFDIFSAEAHGYLADAVPNIAVVIGRISGGTPYRVLVATNASLPQASRERVRTIGRNLGLDVFFSSDPGGRYRLDAEYPITGDGDLLTQWL